MQLHAFGLERIKARDEQHAVARGDTQKRYEADDGGNVEFLAGDDEDEDAANHGQWHVDEYKQRLAYVLELAVQQHENDQ